MMERHITVRQAIERFKNVSKRGDAYLNSVLIGWLHELDGKAMNDVVRAYQSDDELWEYTGTEKDMDKQLLIGEPYTGAYVNWLMYKTDMHNGDAVQANNSLSMFADDYSGWQKQYNRTHDAKVTRMKNVWR